MRIIKPQAASTLTGNLQKSVSQKSGFTFNQYLESWIKQTTSNPKHVEAGTQDDGIKLKLSARSKSRGFSDEEQRQRNANKVVNSRLSFELMNELVTV